MGIVRKEVSDRTLMGKVLKWLFIGFNVIMLLVMISTCSTTGEAINSASANAPYPEAARAGATIGAGLAIGSLLFVWLAGAVILGLFVLLTRRKKTIEVEE